MIINAFTSRVQWLQRLMDPRRDIEAECGHPIVVTIEDYKRLFMRGDVANRIVSLVADESWVQRPEVLENEEDEETDFEQAWKELDKSLGVINVMQRGDVLSGIGRFGVILLGFDDGLSLNEPVASGPRRLLYLRPFDESLATVKSLENDITNERYGLPKDYQIQFTDAELLSMSDPAQKTLTTSTTIHWTRIIHLCDNRFSSDVFGAPRMEKVLNRLLDIRKIAGGSAEMFWKGGFPGLSIEAAPGLEDRVTFDEDATKEQLEAYMNGLQRYLAFVGMQTKSLAPQIADPDPHVKLQLQLIATALGVPWRVLIGSEAAQLASEQDTRAWNKRLHRRRTDYVTPYIIRPLVDRLVEYGVLPEPEELIVNWPDLNSPSDLDKAAIAEKQTNAIAKYVQSQSDSLIPPFHFFTRILNMEDDEADAIIEDAMDAVDDSEDDEGTVAPLPEEDDDIEEMVDNVSRSLQAMNARLDQMERNKEAPLIKDLGDKLQCLADQTQKGLDRLERRSSQQSPIQITVESPKQSNKTIKEINKSDGSREFVVTESNK